VVVRGEDWVQHRLLIPAMTEHLRSGSYSVFRRCRASQSNAGTDKLFPQCSYGGHCASSMNDGVQCVFLLGSNEQEIRMEERTNKQPSSYFLDRVRAVLEPLELDCRCRSKLDDALERFEFLENCRQVRALILDGRNQAERIAALLELVSELDTIGIDESDLGVFDEIASLFADIGLAAACGAEDMIRARSLASSRKKSTLALGDRNAG